MKKMLDVVVYVKTNPSFCLNNVHKRKNKK